MSLVHKNMKSRKTFVKETSLCHILNILLETRKQACTHAHTHVVISCKFKVKPLCFGLAIIIFGRNIEIFIFNK